MNRLKKRSLFASAVAAVLVTAMLTKCSCSRKAEKEFHSAVQIDNKAVSAMDFIKPFSKDFNVPYSEFEVQSGKDTTLVYASGTKIFIPSCALQNNDGSSSAGTVKIRYREMVDYAGIIASGIPMVVKQGANDFLETTGMMEMKAEKDGKEMSIKTGCPIKLDMVNNKEGRNVNLYYLDEDKKSWRTVRMDMKAKVEYTSVMKKGKVKANQYDYEGPAKAAGYYIPVKPKTASLSRFGFHFKIDLSKYPEVNAYDGIIWEYAGKGEDPKKNPWVEKAAWKEMILDKTDNKEVFKLRLISSNRTFETYVRPVFDKEDMEYAMDVFNYRYGLYKKFIDKKKEEKRKWDQEQARLAMVKETTSMIRRTFEIDKFGIWNCDILQSVENPQVIALKIQPVNAAEKIETVYLVDKSITSVISYTPVENKIAEFKYVKEKDYKVLIMDSESKIYEVAMSDCINETKAGKPLVLKADGKVIKDMAGLRAVL